MALVTETQARACYDAALTVLSDRILTAPREVLAL